MSVHPYPSTLLATSNIYAASDDYVITSANFSASNVLQVNGDGADIQINNRSLAQAMCQLDAIQEQLAILVPDPGMEQEWDELRAIREQYQAKLKECQEKSQMWRRLGR